MSEQPKMTFPVGNKLQATQDHCTRLYEELPSGVEFIVVPTTEGCFLYGDGYGFGVPGKPHGRYGSGCLYTSASVNDLIQESVSTRVEKLRAAIVSWGDDSDKKLLESEVEDLTCRLGKAVGCER